MKTIGHSMQNNQKKVIARSEFVEYINRNFYQTMRASSTAVGYDVMITYSNYQNDYVDINTIMNKSHDAIARKLERNY